MTHFSIILSGRRGRIHSQERGSKALGSKLWSLGVLNYSFYTYRQHFQRLLVKGPANMPREYIPYGMMTRLTEHAYSSHRLRHTPSSHADHLGIPTDQHRRSTASPTTTVSSMPTAPSSFSGSQASVAATFSRLTYQHHALRASNSLLLVALAAIANSLAAAFCALTQWATASPNKDFNPEALAASDRTLGRRAERRAFLWLQLIPDSSKLKMDLVGTVELS